MDAKVKEHYDIVNNLIGRSKSDIEADIAAKEAELELLNDELSGVIANEDLAKREATLQAENNRYKGKWVKWCEPVHTMLTTVDDPKHVHYMYVNNVAHVNGDTLSLMVSDEFEIDFSKNLDSILLSPTHSVVTIGMFSDKHQCTINRHALTILSNKCAEDEIAGYYNMIETMRPEFK